MTATNNFQDLSKVGTKIDPFQTKNVIDFKFGKSGISSSQSSKIAKQTGAIPTIIKPRSSLFSKIKSFFKRR